MDNEEELNNIENQDNSAQNPITSEVTNAPIQDGQIPQDSQAIADGSADALGLQNIEVEFEQGNYKQIKSLPVVVSQKISALTKTFIPLVEVALIELTGASTQYKRTSAIVTPSFDQESNLQISFTIVYTVPGYIGVDFEYNDLQNDSKYLYDRISPAGIKITKCEIDTSSGEITINGEF
jgi:hypothetical protein